MDAVGYLPSPIGRIRFVLNEERQLVHIDLNVQQSLNCETPALFKDIFTQFSEYFEGTRRDFTLPLCLNGRAFEMRVFQQSHSTLYYKSAAPFPLNFSDSLMRRIRSLLIYLI